MSLTQRERAYDEIRTLLLGGELGAGSRVSDLAISKRIGMSRTPVREAINRLVTEGLVEHVPHLGAFVRMPDREELEELFDLRELLEGYAAWNAARTIQPDQIAELEDLCGHMRDLIREAQRAGVETLTGEAATKWLVNDSSFHLAILQAAGRKRVLKMVQDLGIMTQLFGHKREELGINNLVWIYAGHRRILRALTRGDGDTASEVIGRHIRRGKGLALAAFDRHSGTVAATGGRPEDWPAAVRDLIRRMEVYKTGAERDR